jgi:hypothetical protein
MNERRSAGLIVGLVSERHCCAFLFGLLWRMPLQCQSSTLIRRITKPYMSINYSYHTYIITYIHNYKIHYSVIMTSCVAQNCFEIFDTWCVESTHICWCADRDYIWCDVECWSCAPRLPAHSSLSWLVWAVMFFFIETSPYDVFLLCRPRLCLQCAVELCARYTSTLEPFAVGRVIKDCCITWNCFQICDAWCVATKSGVLLVGPPHPTPPHLAHTWAMGHVITHYIFSHEN